MESTNPSRRNLLLAAAAAALAGTTARGAEAVPGPATGAPGPFDLPPLPYPENALAPVISARTMGFHYRRHHRAYVDNLNRAVAGTAWADSSLSQIVTGTYGRADLAGLYDNAAQAWNHAFYWLSLRKGGGGEPPAVLKQKLEADFGSVANCRNELLAAATGRFGSGWAWLVQDAGRLAVMSTANADSPIVNGQQPLLAIDVWEHAYYLDYQNLRASYVTAVLDKLINWGFAADNLG